MNDLSDTKRLADATAALASTILAIINSKLQAQLATTVHAHQRGHEVIEPFMTKRQAAKHFQVSLRTIDNWLNRGFLPHYKIGRTVRVKLCDVEKHWNERLLVKRRGW